jgi:hypothetical protein
MRCLGAPGVNAGRTGSRWARPGRPLDGRRLPVAGRGQRATAALRWKARGRRSRTGSRSSRMRSTWRRTSDARSPTRGRGQAASPRRTRTRPTYNSERDGCGFRYFLVGSPGTSAEVAEEIPAGLRRHPRGNRACHRCLRFLGVDRSHGYATRWLGPGRSIERVERSSSVEPNSGRSTFKSSR